MRNAPVPVYRWRSGLTRWRGTCRHRRVLQEPAETLAAKAARLKEKLGKLATEMLELDAYEKELLASPDQQISLTDPDCRSMATSGRGSGVVGYNVQVAVTTEHHLIIAHGVTNSGTDRAQLANMGCQAKQVLRIDKLEAVADHGYYSSTEIRACGDAGIAVTLPKPMTLGAKADGRFGKQDFVYDAAEDVYHCPAGEKLTPKVATEMALHVLDYNITRVMNILGVEPLIAAIRV